MPTMNTKLILAAMGGLLKLPFAALLVMPLLAAAAYEGPMRFSTYWPCDGNGSFCGTRVLAEGAIEADSAAKLDRFLNLPRPRGNELPTYGTIAFDSPGGSLYGGILLGKLIRARKLDTALAPSYDRVNREKTEGYETFLSGAKCASACVLAFAGGVNREVAAGSRMGVHQFSGAARNIGDAATQVTVVQIASYLRDMGVNRELLDIASLVPPTAIYWLQADQLKAARLDNIALPSSPWVLKASASGVPILTLTQEISAGKQIQVGLVRGRDRDRIVVAVSAEFDNRFVPSDRVSGFPVGDRDLACVTLASGGRKIKLAGVHSWERQDSASTTSFRCFGSMSIADAQFLARASSVVVDDEFPKVIGDLSVRGSLGTENFASGIALLLRAN